MEREGYDQTNFLFLNKNYGDELYSGMLSYRSILTFLIGYSKPI